MVFIKRTFSESYQFFNILVSYKLSHSYINFYVVVLISVYLFSFLLFFFIQFLSTFLPLPPF